MYVVNTKILNKYKYFQRNNRDEIMLHIIPGIRYTHRPLQNHVAQSLFHHSGVGIYNSIIIYILYEYAA
jgi:hypothetical protein